MKYFITLAIAVFFNINFLAAQDEGRILRYPHTSATHITFAHAGDIYTVSIDGGLARRVTSSKGEEM